MIRRREHAPELLDETGHDRALLEESLDHIAEVNRLLGGTRAVLRTLTDLASDGATLHILDLGTGSADIPIAIDRWAGTRSLDVRITATDVHPRMLEIARERTRHHDRIRIEAADALELPYRDGAFDLVLLSLTLHHFERDDQVRALREAARVARRAVIVNELDRSVPNYIGARLLAATRWRRNPITRHDGPLSVLRAFRADELRGIAHRAGLHVRSIRRFFFFRLVMVVTR